MAITINKLIGGSINIITNGGGGSDEPAGHEKKHGYGLKVVQKMHIQNMTGLGQ